MLYSITFAEFLHMSIFGNFPIFVVSGQVKCAVLIGTILFSFSFFFWGGISYLENTKYPLDKNCVSCSGHKVVWKLAYRGVKMVSFIQEQKIVMKVAYLSVSKLHTSFKGIKLSGKLPIFVLENWVCLK